MPKVVGTRLMVKERGGKTQLAFRRALGIRGDQDVQFQEIKHRIRTLAVKHFEIGRKPREQDQIIKERFLADVQKAFPIFGDDECANAHLLRYVDRYLGAKAVPSSRFYHMVHGNDIVDHDGDWLLGDSDKSDNVEEHRDTPANSEPPAGLTSTTLHNRSQAISELDEANEEASRMVISDGIQGSMVQKSPGISGDSSPSPTLTDASRTMNRSPSQDPLAAMSIDYDTTSRKHSDQPRRASSASTVSANDSCHTTPIRDFLSRAALGHLLEELMTLGIKNQSRLLLAATWSEEDVNILLRDSVRERRIDKFEAQQLVIALRSLDRQSMRVGN
ncbi:uncharacterized protein F5891DRAFT_286865 [Suillus fuscotomentosus]|uniref:Uncharacterized protein n=1 Tax=Suillus fuscotomentosus TaxID=1912939 RepID=A0AAD4E7G5_9AGAM|nr:uncharacterized protein F5891DRAFT_286865 [Suillus fuscotomentosus]KAG1900767.1 hypothetical protein F5891DRAFT_286865 [Suillus fuscotomentosus]